MLKIGVRLPRQFEDSGDYLADARAMESAGADSLWLDDDGYDPWLVLAGMATINGRIRLVAPGAPTPRNPKNPALPHSSPPASRPCAIPPATAAGRRTPPPWGCPGADPRPAPRPHAGEIAHVGRALDPVDRLDDGRGMRRVE